MKPKEEIRAMLFARICELKHRVLKKELEKKLKTEASLLYDILGEEVPEEYWEEIEGLIGV